MVENSLLRREEGPEGTVRLRMLETIREYALRRLRAAGEEQAVRLRHAEYFLALATEAAAGLAGPRQQVELDLLESEHDNLRALLEWAGQSGQIEVGLRAGVALWPFWSARGHHREGRRWLEDSALF